MSISQPVPKQIYQPEGSLDCWAAALGSWALVTNREYKSIEEYKKIFKNALKDGGLEARKFDEVAGVMQMAWANIRPGSVMKHWNFEVILNQTKYLYLIIMPAHGEQLYSHARVVYGYWEGKLYATDPSHGRITFSVSDFTNFNCMIAVANEYLYGLFSIGIDWQRPL